MDVETINGVVQGIYAFVKIYKFRFHSRAFCNRTVLGSTNKNLQVCLVQKDDYGARTDRADILFSTVCSELFMIC